MNEPAGSTGLRQLWPDRKGGRRLTSLHDEYERLGCGVWPSTVVHIVEQGVDLHLLLVLRKLD